MSEDQETCYKLPNGVLVYCGPLRATWREEGDRVAFRLDCAVRTVVPYMEALIPKSTIDRLPSLAGGK